MATTPAFVPDPQNVKFGPSYLVYGGVSLGYTLNDSIDIAINQNTTDVMVDQSASPISSRITTTEYTVSATFADVPGMLRQIPGADSAGLKDPSGIDLRSISKELLVVPLDPNGQGYRIPCATLVAQGNVTYARETPLGLQVQFRVFTDSAGYAMYFGA